MVVLDPGTGAVTGTGVVTSTDHYIESPAWSTDGLSLAYVDDTSTGTGASAVFSSALYVITRPSDAGAWSAPTLVAPANSGGHTWFNEDPTFNSDGSLWFDRADDSANNGTQQDIISATDNHDGSWTLTPHSTSADDESISFGAIDSIAPGAPTLNPFTLAGTTTFLNWTADVDVSKLNVHRTGSDGSSVDFVAPSSPYADKTTKLGVTYNYTATATDGVGLTGPTSAPRSVTAEGVKLVVSNPTSLSAAKLPFGVSWGVPGNSGATYAVQWAPYGGAARTLAGATAAAHATFGSSTQGQTYSFRALVTDGFGNSSAWTPWTKAVVPFDQSKGSFSTSPSWRVTKGSAFWLGSIKTTTHNKAAMKFTVTSRGVQIIGDKLPSGAKFAVYVGKTYKGTFSTKASKTKHRQVLYTVSFSSLAKRTIKVVAVVASGKVLKIDGVAAPK